MPTADMQVTVDSLNMSGEGTQHIYGTSVTDRWICHIYILIFQFVFCLLKLQTQNHGLCRNLKCCILQEEGPSVYFTIKSTIVKHILHVWFAVSAAAEETS